MSVERGESIKHSHRPITVVPFSCAGGTGFTRVLKQASRIASAEPCGSRILSASACRNLATLQYPFGQPCIWTGWLLRRKRTIHSPSVPVSTLAQPSAVLRLFLMCSWVRSLSSITSSSPGCGGTGAFRARAMIRFASVSSGMTFTTKRSCFSPAVAASMQFRISPSSSPPCCLPTSSGLYLEYHIQVLICFIFCFMPSWFIHCAEFFEYLSATCRWRNIRGTSCS
mmetsp:Transcript_21365/g.53824  ORF Transcript_21365/g.53824 Transcript_21365/m.53824 type:complete len:226 (+) Transcript_21365:1051-1728(+)